MVFNVFKGTLLALARERSILIWALAFPLVLSTMFVFMFANLDENAQLKPIRTVVVADAGYEAAPGFAEVMEALSEPGDGQLLDVAYASSEEEAVEIMRATDTGGSVFNSGVANEGAVGYVATDADGTPSVHVRGGVQPNSVDSANQSVLKTVVDNYLRSRTLIEDAARENPAALADAQAVSQLLGMSDFTEKIDVTRNPPKATVRFYFALLAMAALFGGQVGMIAICRVQPNLSALGARRAFGAVSRARTLVATLGASWALSFACLLVAYAYVRVVAGVDFAGRDGACVVALAASSLLATALGTLIGSVAKIDAGVKGGLLSAVVCLSSLFAGLYGTPVMELADDLNAAFPLLELLNPATQISQAFYSIMYYDTFQRTAEHVAVLLAMTAALLAVSSILVRRQRYASL